LLAFKQPSPGKGDKQQQGEDVEEVLVLYNSEGRYDSTVKLQTLFHPAQFAVFSSGEILASGIKISPDRKLTSQPFVAIFDQQGRIIKELTLMDDIQGQNDTAEPATETSGRLSQARNPDAAKAEGKLTTDAFKAAMTLGVAVAASDGNIYLMRATRQPVIYVVARDGTLVRRLAIAAPSENAEPASVLQVAGGKVIVEFIEREASGNFRRDVIVVANAETGEPMARYIAPPEVGGALACYTPDGFTFLTRKAGGMVMKRTYPQ